MNDPWEEAWAEQREYEKQQERKLMERQTAQAWWQERQQEAVAQGESCAQQIAQLEQVQILLQMAAERAREQARCLLEELVTKALRYLFGPTYRCVIEITDKGGQPSAEFDVATQEQGHEVRNRPYEARGGGVVDAVSLALRVALLETLRPRLRGPLMLDEPGKHMSMDYIEPLVTFLTSVHHGYGRQVIVVSHNAALIAAAQGAFEVRQQAGISRVTRVGEPTSKEVSKKDSKEDKRPRQLDTFSAHPLQ